MSTEQTKNAANEPAEQDLIIIRDKKTRTLLMWAAVIIAVIVVGVIVYIYGFRQPDIQRGNDAIGQAAITQILQGNDSTALAQYEQVADNYGHAAGNLASLNAAIILYKQGDYQKAIDRLNAFDPSEAVVGAAAYSLKGDCYVNLDNLDKAVDCFKSAISQSDDNPYYTPFFMLKLATVYNAQANNSAAAAIYREIKAKYPAYGPEHNIDIDKYIYRAEELAK